MPQVIRDISSAALSTFDRLVFIRDVCVNNFGVQILSSLFFAVSLFVSIILFVYWCSCAWRVLEADGMVLTEAEIEPMRWDRKLRNQLRSLFHTNGLILY